MPILTVTHQVETSLIITDEEAAQLFASNEQMLLAMSSTMPDDEFRVVHEKHLDLIECIARKSLPPNPDIVDFVIGPEEV